MSDKKEKKGFFAEFKKFISRGNVVDLAVGIIIGGAFTAIVNSLVNDILMPLISLVKKVRFTDMYVGLIQESVAPLEGITLANGAVISAGEPVYRTYIYYGNFIQQILNFLLIALSLFTIIKIINKVREASEEVKRKLIKEEIEEEKQD